MVATIPWPERQDVVEPIFYIDATGTMRRQPWEPGGQRELEISRTAELILIPNGIALLPSGALLRRDFPTKAAKHGALERFPNTELAITRTAIGGAITRRLEEPVFLAEARWPNVYGHQLLEIVPTLALLDHVPGSIKVATSARLSDALLKMFAALGVDRARIEPIEGATLCRCVFLADPPVRLGAAVHPIARRAFATLGLLGAQSSIERCSRLFVSRSRVRTRQLANEREIESLFSRYGFTIVQPELHPIEDQIALFAGAKMLAGLGGSAMHSAVFSAPDTPVLIIQTRQMATRTDTALAQAPRRLGFVLGESEAGAFPSAGRWWVDAAIVEAAIKAHFGL